MMSIQERCQELIALTKQYLLQEYALTDRILSEPDTYLYFLSYAQQQQRVKQGEQKKQSPTPTPALSPPTRTLAPSIPIPILAPIPTVVYPAARGDPVHPVISSPAPSPAPAPASTSPPLSPSPPTSSKPFQLDSPPPIHSIHFGELRKIIQEKLPKVQLVDHLPDDGDAKKRARQWECPKQAAQVLLLSCHETPKQAAILVNIEKALAIYGIHVQMIDGLKLEQSSRWEDIFCASELKLIIISDASFHRLSGLKKYYKEDAKNGRHYLKDRSLVLLSDVSSYLKEPWLKSALWSTLSQLLELTHAVP